MGVEALRFIISVVAASICVDRRARPAVRDGTPGDPDREVTA